MPRNNIIIAGRGAWMEEARKRWGWILGLGLLFAILGLIGLGMLFAVTVVSVLFFGVLLLVGGIVHLAQVFTRHGAGSKLVQVLIALLYMSAAVLIITDPVAAAISLTFVLGAMLLVVGLLRVVASLDVRPIAGWGSLMVTGLLEILLAVLVFSQWPVSGLWVIGLFISVDLLVAGLGYVALALQLRKGAGREMEA